MTKFVITVMLLSSVIFNTIMVPLDRGRFAVVNQYSRFSMNIFPEEQIYTKNCQFWRMGSNPIFLMP